MKLFFLVFGLGAKMDIIKIVKETYPELEGKDFETKLLVQDDSDGQGAYLAQWNYSKPIPDGLTLGKPTA
jgi:hypothetical protein